MGQIGSDTRKASIHSSLYNFTKWHDKEMGALFHRSQFILAETFALRQAEFEFLLGRDLINFIISREIFQEMLDTDKNKLVDKFEIVLLITLLSALTNSAKVEFMFELCNFNGKGYLTRSELSLLLNTITRAVEKADPKIKTPPRSFLQDLIDIAFKHFCKVDPKCIALRKPELVKFAAEVVQVQRYLDAWRGHAGQVLLPKTEKWRDPCFPCNETSISPSRAWIQIASTPPAHFVYWRRKELVGNDDEQDQSSGSRILFTHLTSTIKSVDKRKKYEGPGAIGNGILMQGMLADRWLLNGFACVMSRPTVFPFLLPPTGQESIGRFCVRIFEGASWRSVFLDDRFPCGPDFLPLFAHSSDSNECWPLVIEKAFAKYLGSYGQVGLCSSRLDSATMGLRMLTGGHVVKLACADFEWNSVEAAIRIDRRDGALFISQIRAEGSIVAFGRSESLAMHNSTLMQSPRDPMPHGFLFPLVRTFTKEDGYKFIVVRDAFGHLVPPADPYSTQGDFATGHCHIHEIRIEDLLKSFDTMVVCRFPDALRVGADREGFPQWQTHITKDNSAGPAAPAKFLLKISSPAPLAPKAKNVRPPRLSKLRADAEAKSHGDSDVINQSMKTRFNYARPRMVPGEVGTASKEPEISDEEKDDPEIDDDENKEEELDEQKPVAVALTVSSSCDWTVGGSPEAGAQVRLRIVPSVKTLKALKRHRAVLEAKEEKKRAMLAEQKRRQAELLAALPEEEDNDDGEDNNPADFQDDANANDPVSKIENNLDALASPSNDGESAKIHLSPTFKSAIPSSTQLDEQVKKKKLSFSEKERILQNEFCEIRCGANSCWLSQNLELWPGEYYVSADVSYSMPKDKMIELTAPIDLSEAPWLDNRPHEVDNVWLQVSSCAPVEIRSLTAKECPKFASTVSSILIAPEKFPFSYETPSEASSRGVDAMLSRLKAEAALLDADYVATRNTLKKIYKSGKRANVI